MSTSKIVLYGIEISIGNSRDSTALKKCALWCDLHARGIFGPHFLKNESGAQVIFRRQEIVSKNDPINKPLRSCDLTLFYQL